MTFLFFQLADSSILVATRFALGLWCLDELPWKGMAQYGLWNVLFEH